jgi:hypothetical protein
MYLGSTRQHDNLNSQTTCFQKHIHQLAKLLREQLPLTTHHLSSVVCCVNFSPKERLNFQIKTMKCGRIDSFLNNAKHRFIFIFILFFIYEVCSFEYQK